MNETTITKPGATMAERFSLMEYIKAANPSTPDATLADEAAVALGREVQYSTVKSYRAALGIASVKKPTAVQLQGRIDRLEAFIVLNNLEIPAL